MVIINLFSVSVSLLRSSAHFLVGFFGVFAVELYELFIYFGYKPLIGHIISIHFLPSSMLSFCFASGFFCCAKAFKFD